MQQLPTSLTSIEQVLDAGAVHSVFQPIVELDTGRVVAYEALARGPAGPLATPDALFAAARAAGRLAELDHACRRAAVEGALEQRLLAPLTLFVNVEPEVLDTAPLEDLLAIARDAPGELHIVLEITERALAARPAELLRTVDRVRELGWRLALDDVGAEPASLAFMPLIHPDVVKLDLRLVQDRPGPAVAEIMNAVNSYAEQSGALVLAEGIETKAHLEFARALGATLGQGWLLGRPGAGAHPDYVVGELDLPPARPVAATSGRASPFACLPDSVPLRRSPKALLIELSKQLEREALRLGDTCIVAATFQEARHFTPSTRERYAALVAATGFVCALGDDLPPEPMPGVRGAALAEGDPVRSEWDVVVLSPHYSVALLARDLGDTGEDMERRFEYALTYQRDTVVRAAHELLTRVVARLRPPPESSAQPSAAAPAAASLISPIAPFPAVLLERALAATTSGVTVADMTRPDQPLVYANSAFESLSGLPNEQVLGRNCRFLQGPGTHPAASGRIRAAIEAGLECRETLLNYRGIEREPWWNEVYLAPVLDDDGAVVQYIGLQNDITARVHAELALQQERERADSYLTRIEQLAYTDALTGLPNRRRVQERVEAALWEVRAGGGALALLYLDLDGFKAVNDLHGHAAGDELLVVAAQRMQACLRRSDLLSRLGGDEFLVVLLGLEPGTAHAEAQQVGGKLAAAVAAPLALAGQPVVVGASVGISVYPGDAEDFGPLLHLADMRMYSSKYPAVS